MSARVFVLTAGFGEGHNAAARALVAACDAQDGPGTALLVDAFALASPRLNAVSRRAYLAMINRTPKLWSALYAGIDRCAVFPALLWTFRRETRVLAQLIEREQPAVLCSTYPVYAFMVARLVAQGRCAVPHFNVVTDSISINSLWWRAKCAGWFLPNADSAAVLFQAGVPTDRLHVSGFPVHGFFAERAEEFTPPDLATGAAPRVLYLINSGSKDAEATARRLLAEQEWEVTCAVGRDDALRRRLLRLAANRARPAVILGWTDQIPRLLMTHHVLVSKAGGATTQEAIAARCPMIVNQIVPGQEEGNYELLRRHGIGALAETPPTVIEALRRAFAQRGHLWREWRASLSSLVRPNAANDIAAHLLSVAPGSVAPSLRSGPPPEFTALAASPSSPTSLAVASAGTRATPATNAP